MIIKKNDMRTPIEIYTNFIEKSKGEKLFAAHPKNEFILKLIEQAQYEGYFSGYEEGYSKGLDKGYESCKSDYATQITYNK